MFEAITQNYHLYEHTLASLQLALAMFGMGALLAPGDFVLVIRRPWPLVVGLLTQLLLVPAWAFFLGKALPLPDGIVAGLILVAAVPGGTMSNIVTYLGGGHVALSISLTAITTTLSLVVTPALLGLLASALMPDGFAMPVGAIARDIAMALLLPLLVGMAVGHRWSRHRRLLSRIGIRTSIALIVVLVVGASAAGRLDPMAYGWIGPASLVALAVGSYAVATLATRTAGLVAADRLAVAVEVTLRNGNLAVLIAVSMFPATGVPDPVGGGVMFAALLYGGIGLGVAAAVAWMHPREAD